MKKQFVIMICAAFFSITAVNAQGGGGQRQSPEERTKATMEKLEVLNLDADAKTKKWTDEIEPSLRPQKGNSPRPQ